MMELEEHDLGEGVTVSWVYSRHVDRIVGLIEKHDCLGTHSGGYVFFEQYDPKRQNAVWTLEKGEPPSVEGLTLSPSLLCKRCGHHGWIKEGRWVPA